MTNLEGNSAHSTKKQKPDSVFTVVFSDTTSLTKTFTGKIPFALVCNTLQKPMDEDYGLESRVEAYTKNCVVWHKIKFVNDRATAIHAYLFVCKQSDSCYIKVDYPNGEREETFLGSSLNPKQKDLPTTNNLLELEIPPNSWKTYTLKTKYLNQTDPVHFTHIFTGEKQKYQNSLIFKYSAQSFYFGVLMLFCLVSIFMYFSFRDRVFILFGLLMVSFAFYFLNYHGIFSLMVFHPFLDGPFFSINNLFASGIVLSLTWFVKDYIQLKERLSKWHRILVFTAILVALFPNVARAFGVNMYLVAYIFNSLLIIWTIVVMIPIGILVRRGHGSARVVLISIVILFVSGVLFILTGMGLLPKHFFTSDSIQIGLLIFSGLLFYGLFEKISLIKADRLRMAIEKQKSDELLFNILPETVAEELRQNGKSDAREFQEITVLFSDFVAFTETAEKLSATELVEEINHCFEAFDHILEKYKIEKIKTIGDAYMAAGGLPVPAEDSVKNTVLAALEMQEFMVKRKSEFDALNTSHSGRLGGAAFDMRVGIHTGPVVAGIVGVKKFQYDIWGDTVNTASRMESHGAISKVNISNATYELIKQDDRFTFESRGKVAVKGKGEMEMHFVALKANQDNQAKA